METVRENNRVKTDIHCSWGLTDACPRNGKITSLSIRGCFIKTTAAASDGQTIFVNCWLPERRWMMLQGEVIYHLERIGFGLLFKELNDEQTQLIASLIEHYVNNPFK
jgi:hypothetical protein